MRVGTLWGMALAVALIAASCGFVDDARTDPATIVSMMNKQASTLRGPEPTRTERSRDSEADRADISGAPYPSGVKGTTAESEVAEGVPPPASTTLEATVPSTLSAEDRLAIERCRRIQSFRSAAYDLYRRSVGNPTVDSASVEYLMTTIRDLTVSVSPSGAVHLQSLLNIMEPKVNAILKAGPDASVQQLQDLVTRITPTVTELMTDLQQVCPLAVDEDDVTKVEKANLLSPVNELA